MLTIGQISLVSETRAYCKVHWTRPGKMQGTCSFSVYIETRRGESWQARREKILVEARRTAEAFLMDSQISVMREDDGMISINAAL
jgi:hypothetical protein